MRSQRCQPSLGAVVGLLSTSFTTANVPASLRQQLRKLGGASLTSPAGALGFYFLLFVLTISLFACAQLAAARREEAEQRFETLFAFPVSRHRWLAGRLLLAAALLALAVRLLLAVCVPQLESARRDARGRCRTGPSSARAG